MKKIVFFGALALLVGGLLLRLAQNDPGYVLIVGWGTTIEMRLGFAILMMLVIVLILASGLKNSFLIFKWFKNSLTDWQMGRQKKHSQLLEQGFYAVLGGNWDVGKKTLQKAAKNKKSSALPLVAAAACAEQSGHYSEAEKLLAKAEQAGAAPLAVLMLQVQASWRTKNYVHCVMLLNQAKQLAPTSVGVLRWLQKVYTAQQDWHALEVLMPELERVKAFSPEVLQGFQRQMFFARLGEMGAELEGLIAQRAAPISSDVSSDSAIDLGEKGESGEALLPAVLSKAAPSDTDMTRLQSTIDQYWGDLPKTFKGEPEFIERYCHILRLLNKPADAETLIRVTSRSQWYPNLILFYGVLDSPKPKRQLQVAQEWEESHSNDAILQLTLGRLCIKNELWGQAKAHLKNSLALKPEALAYVELAKLLAFLGEAEESVMVYKEGLLYSAEPGPKEA